MTAVPTRSVLSRGAVPLLDEHHLVVVAEAMGDRRAFARGLAGELEPMPETRVVQLNTAEDQSIEGICRQLEGQLGHRRLAHRRRIQRSTAGLIDFLRDFAFDEKRQYFIWEEADALLEADVRLFGRVANALLGAAAEREYVSAERLVLQRVIFLGGDKLGAYAEESAGQFCSWELDDGSCPFLSVLPFVSRPSILTVRLDG